MSLNLTVIYFCQLNYVRIKIVKLFIIRLYLSESNITYVFIHVDKKQIHTIFHTIIYTETNTPFDPNIKKKNCIF
jgi:hypothetical protein